MRINVGVVRLSSVCEISRPSAMANSSSTARSSSIRYLRDVSAEERECVHRQVLAHGEPVLDIRRYRLGPLNGR